jgi:hypothetical protein
MTQPDFETMNRQDLHAYVLAHRDVQQAFYAYVDKLHTEADWVEMPALQSTEEMENYPEFLEYLRQSAERQE